RRLLAPIEPVEEVPSGRPRVYALGCLAVDVTMLVLAALGAVLARRHSAVAFPPVGWVVAFAAGTVVLYWSWRLYTFRVRLRPLADALLVAAATGLAAMCVLTIRSLAGSSGVGDALLPLWAFAAVYGVAGRMAFYLYWTVRIGRTPDEPAETAGDDGEADA